MNDFCKNLNDGIPARSFRDFTVYHNSWRKVLLLLMIWATCLPLAVFSQPKILFIGNSFTYGGSDATNKIMKIGGVPAIFARMALAGSKVKPVIMMTTAGGQNFRFHNSNPATLAAIQTQQWDYVILQNYSTEPTHLVDAKHRLADHFTYGMALYQKVMSNNPLTRVILYETWSRAAAHPFITGVSSARSFASTTEFQSELRANYRQLASSLNRAWPANPRVLVAPVGDAWEYAGGLRAASDPLYAPLHASDNYHGNDNGYYLSAAVFYAVVYGASPCGLSTNTLISDLHLNLTMRAATLEKAAWDAIQSSPP